MRTAFYYCSFFARSDAALTNLSSSQSASIPHADHECVDNSNIPTTSSLVCSVCRNIIFDESGFCNCLYIESATKLDDSTAASHQEDEDTAMDTSNNTSSETEEENSDDDEDVEGEEKWELIEVIAVKDLKKKMPEMCLGKDCTLGMSMCLFIMILDLSRFINSQQILLFLF